MSVSHARLKFDHRQLAIFQEFEHLDIYIKAIGHVVDATTSSANLDTLPQEKAGYYLVCF